MHDATDVVTHAVEAQLDELKKKFLGEDEKTKKKNVKLTDSSDLEVRALCNVLAWDNEDVEDWINRCNNPIQAAAVGITGANVTKAYDGIKHVVGVGLEQVGVAV